MSAGENISLVAVLVTGLRTGRGHGMARHGAGIGAGRLHAAGHIAVAFIVAALVGTTIASPAAAAQSARPAGNFGSATVSTETLSGADQYETAVAISKSLSPDGGLPIVYLVSGSAGAEALAAGPAAASAGGAILYTPKDSLPAAVSAELVRLAPARVGIVGSAADISDAVVGQVIAALPPSTVVERVAGSDAYGIAAGFSAATYQPNSGARYHPVAPGRVLDSRIPLGAYRFRAKVKQSFVVAGLAGVPPDAVAVTGNVTIVNQTQAGFVTVAPNLTSGVTPATSTINFPWGDIRANGITVSLGAGGQLEAMYSAASASSTVDIILDVTGFFSNDASAATYQAVPPGRVLDSRIGLGAQSFHARVKQPFAVAGVAGVPPEAVAVTGNVTIVGQTQAGYVTVAPSLTSGVIPQTSTINFPRGDIRANGVTVSLGTNGQLEAMYSAADANSTVQIVFDVTGFFSHDPAGATFHALAPGRVLDSRIPLGTTKYIARSSQPFAVAGHAGVPSDALEVTGNVTVVGQTQAGYVTVAPSLTSGVPPGTSTINFPMGDIRANGTTVLLGNNGWLAAMYWAAYSTSTVDVIFDVTGFFAKDHGSEPNYTSSTVVVASSGSPTDAVLASTVAVKLGIPFLLISHGVVPAATAGELARLQPNRVIVVGDSTSVPDSVLALIRVTVPAVDRLAGADTYGTGQIIAYWYFKDAHSAISMSASIYAGGVASVPLAIHRNAPILYLQDTDVLPLGTREALLSQRPTALLLVGAISVINQAELVGFSDGRLIRPTETAVYPSYDSGYHDPGELYTVIKAHEIAYPTLVHVFSIGKSYEGRDIWAAKVTSNVLVDVGKPETMVDALHHANEHLGVEQALYLLETLTAQYGTDPLVTRLVNERVTWIIFAVNPDGWTYDLTGGAYQMWRKNRQPAAGSPDIGTDINRNYPYKFACCGASSSLPRAWNYHGTGAWSSPEAHAVSDFVNSRVFGGVQLIKTHVSLHANGELVLYPYAYTVNPIPADMTADDHAVFVAMAQTMAGMNGYRYGQSSSALYPTDGDEIDWMYHANKIFSFTVELYPRNQSTATADYYPPWSVVAAQTARNRGMLLYVMNMAACPYTVIGKAAQYCPSAPPIIP